MEDEDWELPAPAGPPVTMVLVGRTGNGKSATGNSIIGKRVFKSKNSFAAVTETSQLKSSILPDGRVVNVVDTPGLFDPKTPLEFVGEEIVKCIGLANQGLHGILLVLSTRNRFTPEELAAVEGLQALFGPSILKYMIVVFTGGDELADDDEDLDTYLSSNAPDTLRDFLEKCNHRVVLFDNKTEDQYKKNRQVTTLLKMVDKVLEENHGQPYSNDLFQEAKARASELGKQEEASKLSNLKEVMAMAQKEQLAVVIALLEEKFRIQNEELQKHLIQERHAREQIEHYAKVAKIEAENNISNLRAELEKANREREEMNRRAAPGCTIL